MSNVFKSDLFDLKKKTSRLCKERGKASRIIKFEKYVLNQGENMLRKILSMAVEWILFWKLNYTGYDSLKN